MIISKIKHKKIVLELTKDIKKLEMKNNKLEIEKKCDKEEYEDNIFYKDQKILNLEKALREEKEKNKKIKISLDKKNIEVKNIMNENLILTNKLNVCNDIKKQFLEESNLALRIHWIGGSVTPDQVKKLMSPEKFIELYTKLSLMV